MEPKLTTTTVALVSGMFGGALAWKVAVPTTPVVKGTATLITFAGKFTLVGTAATAGLVELRLTVKPPCGAGADKLKVRDSVAPVPTVALLGENPIEPITCTG
jgi:hypothetical protein